MKEIIKKIKQLGADQAELFVLETKNQSVQFENGAFKSVDRSVSRGGAMRAIKKGRLGFATTTEFDQIDGWLKETLETTHFGDKTELTFSSPDNFKSVETFDPRVAQLSEDELINIGSQAIAHLKKYDPNILSFCTIGQSLQNVSILTSEGFEESYDKTLFYFMLGGRLIDGKNILESQDEVTQITFNFDLGSYLTSVIEPFRQSRKNVALSSGPTNVILTPRALSGILLALEKGLAGNAVSKGISPLKDKMQRKILDERITLIDDGTLRGAAHTAPYDDEGNPTSKKSIFDKGVLKNYLLDLRSSHDLNMFPTGNGRRTGLQPPVPTVSSWVLEGGERQFDEIFDEVKEAVLVDQLTGLLTSAQINGDFSGNISLGFKVENGQIVGRVKDFMISGNVYDLLSEKQLVEISQDQRWIAGAYGGTHMLPTLFLKDISLSTN